MGEENISIFLVFFATLLAVVLVLSKYLHDKPVLATLLPEAAMVLAVGMIAGFFIHLVIGKRYAAAQQEVVADDDNVDEEDVEVDLSALLSFSPEIFFIALIPPIIFNSGLRIGALFFRHIAPIVLFAVLGTTISAVSIAFMLKGVLEFGLCIGSSCSDFNPSITELLTFGALISSTDPVSTLAVFQAKRVDPQLFYLVFGESVLNDALSIVLFDSLSKFVAKQNNFNTITIGIFQFLIDLTLDSIGSLCLGCLSGVLSAMLFKQVDMRQNRLLEISVYLLLMYIPFLLAQIMHLSGIVTILFTGITANRYVVPNLSPITKVNADMLFRLLAHLAETSIFLELGLSVFGLIGHWNWSFIGWSLLACFIGRALNVYPISFIFNRCLLRGTDSSDDDNNTTSIATGEHSKATRKDVTLEDGFTSPDTQYYKDGIKMRMISNDNGNNDKNKDNIINNNNTTIMTIPASFSYAESDVTATPLRRKDLKIRPSTKHMLWFSGLRGAVAYACVRTFPDNFGHQKDFTMTTMAIVLTTVFILGGTTDMALSYLNIDMNVDEESYMKESLREPVVASFFTTLDDNYIRPYVIRDYKVMKHLDESDCMSMSGTGTRSRRPSGAHPTVEMTESNHFENVRDDDEGILKLVRQDSLFDYGAQ